MSHTLNIIHDNADEAYLAALAEEMPNGVIEFVDGAQIQVGKITLAPHVVSMALFEGDAARIYNNLTRSSNTHFSSTEAIMFLGREMALHPYHVASGVLTLVDITEEIPDDEDEDQAGEDPDTPVRRVALTLVGSSLKNFGDREKIIIFQKEYPLRARREFSRGISPKVSVDVELPDHMISALISGKLFEKDPWHINGAWFKAIKLAVPSDRDEVVPLYMQELTPEEAEKFEEKATPIRSIVAVDVELTLLKSSDAINPDHYADNPSGVSCIDVTEAMYFNPGNAVKYLWRLDKKDDPIQELNKTLWYIDKELSTSFKTPNDNADEGVSLAKQAATHMSYRQGSAIIALVCSAKAHTFKAKKSWLWTAREHVSALLEKFKGDA